MKKQALAYHSSLNIGIETNVYNHKLQIGSLLDNL